ncbi:MAG TPA: rhodanese-like domain-containing protein [Actinomycetota bacterium]|jgi:rhodanese-related sulfurtransferase
MTDTPDLSDPQAAHQRRDDVQFVDVREPYEWEAGRIEGAIHVPLNALLAGAGDLDPTKPVVAYCTVGQRSEVARHLLKARGFEAYNLEGGLERWLGRGLPFTGTVA